MSRQPDIFESAGLRGLPGGSMKTKIINSLGIIVAIGMLPSSMRWQSTKPQDQSPMAGNIITGRVTTDDMTPLPGITITATRTTNIIVQDEEEKPVADALVTRNGFYAGTSDAEGKVHITNLAIGDKLVARKKVYEQTTSKQNHSQDGTQNWAYRVYITSLTIPKDTEPVPYTVTDNTTVQVLVVKKSNTLIGFNLLVSVEWDTNLTFLTELFSGFRNASSYLYDATDGQMVFDTVTIYENNQEMGNADYQIRASNQEWPRAHLGGLLQPDWHIFLGRQFDGQSSNTGRWDIFNGYATQIHEFGHYSLGLYDSYFAYLNLLTKSIQVDSSCTSLVMHYLQNTWDTNATLMDYQYNASEFADKEVPSLWSSTCEFTDQWQRTGKSDWEAIVDLYRDTNPEPRWILRRPANYGSVVIGPKVLPVYIWTRVQFGSIVDTFTCEPPKIYQWKDAKGNPTEGASIVLHRIGRDIDQGKTDKFGMITVLGAGESDKLIGSYGLLNLYSKTISISCNPQAPGSPSQMNSADIVILEPAAFDLQVSTQPGNTPGGIQVIVTAPEQLPAPPETNLTQHGGDSIPVPLAYDSEIPAYTGEVTLNPTLTPTGIITVLAANAGGQTVEISANFSMAPVSQGEEAIVVSGDGQAELHLQPGTLSADGQVSINPMRSFVSIPDKKVLLSGPYTIRATTGVSLQTPSNFVLYYLDRSGTLMNADLDSAQIYQEIDGIWTPIPSNASQSQPYVSAAISEFDTYAVLANWEAKVFLPLVSLNGTNQSSFTMEPTTIQGGADDALASAVGGLMPTFYKSITKPDSPDVLTTTTNNSGIYTFSDLPPGIYTITPSLGSHTFTPAFREVFVPPDAYIQDFVRGDIENSDMISIPGGEFQMGCDPAHFGYPDGGECEGSNIPLHAVYLDDYSIDRYEVTNAEYEKCVSEGYCAPPDSPDSLTRHPYYPNFANYPVINVSWSDAYNYCAWAGEDLPSEAQWEKAARGSSGTRAYPWGDASPSCGTANIITETECKPLDTAQVGSFGADTSPYGVMDMAGNVTEWVADWFESDYYQYSPYNNPINYTYTGYKSWRGSNFRHGWYHARIYHRIEYLYYDLWALPDTSYFEIGFRCTNTP